MKSTPSSASRSSVRIASARSWGSPDARARDAHRAKAEPVYFKVISNAEGAGLASCNGRRHIRCLLLTI